LSDSQLCGRQCCLRPAFKAAFSSFVRVFALDESRLKAGCSQDWLPHKRQCFSNTIRWVK